MSEEKLKDKRITIRITDELYDDFVDYIKCKSEEIGTKITQSQAFEILLNEAKCEERIYS